MMQSLALYARRARWLRWFFDNPLLVREMRRRMRGRLFSWSLIAYLGALGAVSCVLMFIDYPTLGEQVSAREMIQRIGRIGSTLFKGIWFVEGFIALFIAPMLTAGLATAEKEKDTFDFLRVTTLKASTFVIGCLLTTACFLFLIFTCTLPILGLTFIFGGVSLAEILTFNLTLFLTALAVSAWGIFNSTSYKRSRAVHGSIVVVFILVLQFGVRYWRYFRAQFGGGGGGGAAGGLFGNPTYIICGLLVLVIVIFSVAAARRLYDPENRLFNYKQYTVLFLAVLGVMAGRVAWRMEFSSAPALDPSELNGMLNLYYFIGWILMATAVLLFSVGRVEMGDEVWRLRLARPFFRRVDERSLLFGFYLLVWLGALIFMMLRWAPGGPFQKRFILSLPVLLAAWVFMLALSRLFNCLSHGMPRNRATIALLVVLIFAWGLFPLLGYFIGETGGAYRMQVAEPLKAFSPFVPIYRIWDNQTNPRQFITVAILLGVALLALLPTQASSLKRRLEVSYDWNGPASA